MSKNKDSFPGPADPTDNPYSKQEDYRKIVIAKLEAARALQIEFAAAALQNGATAEDLPRMLADAMKDGSVPSVVDEGIVFRSDPPRPVFLEGEIPPEALSVEVYGDFIFPQAFTDPDNHRDVYDLADESNGAFTAVGERSFAEPGQQMQDTILARLDGAIAPFTQDPNRM